MYVFAAKKKTTVDSLLDNTRSRNIEIFLPSFSLKVQSLDTDLDQQLNAIDGSTKLNVEHIVALKRYVYICMRRRLCIYNHAYMIAYTFAHDSKLHHYM